MRDRGVWSPGVTLWKYLRTRWIVIGPSRLRVHTLSFFSNMGNSILWLFITSIFMKISFPHLLLAGSGQLPHDIKRPRVCGRRSTKGFELSLPFHLCKNRAIGAHNKWFFFIISFHLITMVTQKSSDCNIELFSIAYHLRKVYGTLTHLTFKFGFFCV